MVTKLASSRRPSTPRRRRLAQAGHAAGKAAARRRVRVDIGRRAGDDAEGDLGEALVLGLAEQEQEAGLGQQGGLAATKVGILRGRGQVEGLAELVVDLRCPRPNRGNGDWPAPLSF